jgi:hypothetical protein
VASGAKERLEIWSNGGGLFLLSRFTFAADLFGAGYTSCKFQSSDSRVCVCVCVCVWGGGEAKPRHFNFPVNC